MRVAASCKEVELSEVAGSLSSVFLVGEQCYLGMDGSLDGFDRFRSVQTATTVIICIDNRRIKRGAS
jgi:hypothetical protein